MIMVSFYISPTLFILVLLYTGIIYYLAQQDPHPNPCKVPRCRCRVGGRRHRPIYRADAAGNDYFTDAQDVEGLNVHFTVQQK